MSRSRRTPKYRYYKPKNLGVVRIDGKDHYLGSYDSAESWEKYHRLIAEWLGGQQSSTLPATDTGEGNSSPLSVSQGLLAYWGYAEGYYVRNGEPTKELTCMRDALRPLRRLYGSLLAGQFGPSKLKTVRNYMIDEQDLCRNEINKRIGRVKRFFNWAVSEELVCPSIAHGLASVKGLKKGRTRARESEPVKPVPDAWVNATLRYLPPQLVAMIEVQRHTGMRPGEVVSMRGCEIDMSQEIWVYRPEQHKNDWRDQPRAVALGPKTQSFITPFLERREDVYLFSPQEAQLWRLQNRVAVSQKKRKTPVYPSELRAREKAKRLRRLKRAKREPGTRYTTESYWKAVDYAFKKAEQSGETLNRWFPNQLRHARATELRKKFGIEATRVSLGHARLNAPETLPLSFRDMGWFW